MSVQLEPEPAAAVSIDLDRLTERACAGDAEALTTLLFEARERVRGVIERRIRRDWKLSAACSTDDALQDACLLAIRDLGRGKFRPEPGVSPFECFIKWFSTIARHHLSDLLDAAVAQKRGGRRHRVTCRFEGRDAAPDLPEAVLVSIAAPSRDLKRGELLAAVRAGLDRISPAHRHVLELKMVFGRTHKQMALELGKEETAVRKMLSRAIGALAAEVGDYARYITRV